MKAEDELTEQIVKHTATMEKVFANIRTELKEKEFKDLFDLAFAYFSDSKHFFEKKKLVQAFEALMISWAYIDAGLRLDVFELLDNDLKDYFTK
ncbi:Uncharacterised protein [Candidatus Tiddalikarchaeum anstoanum]|nr:Uncharacterised protein [Candidatus Tiddalikarchaeum anstoanum]